MAIASCIAKYFGRRSALTTRVANSIELARRAAQAAAMTPANDPLHGVTLERLLTELVAHFGWEELGRRIAIRCFLFDPSIKSSLAFLRKTPWARAKVEEMYVRWKTGR